MSHYYCGELCYIAFSQKEGVTVAHIAYPKVASCTEGSLAQESGYTVAYYSSPEEVDRLGH